jgi:hypothetical protein
MKFSEKVNDGQCASDNPHDGLPDGLLEDQVFLLGALPERLDQVVDATQKIDLALAARIALTVDDVIELDVANVGDTCCWL